MSLAAIADLPEWLLGGVALGAALTVVVAVIFLVGERLFEDDPPARADGGDERRRRELRAYLEAIGERYVEDRSVAGVPVEFYLPERDVAITFDAKAFFDLEGASTHVVLCEHEMRGVHLGARLPFETPDLGASSTQAAAAGPAGDGPRWAAGRRGERRGGDASRDRRDAMFSPDDRREVAAAFEVLGLPTDADLAAIRRAYRRRVKEVHPDQGGDEERFREVQEAYEAAREYAD